MSTEVSTSNPNFSIRLRRSEDRGNADHGWLKTFHTFSFAMYQDGEYDSFGALRVINEDRVTPGEGFGTHAHREFEIFSYIIAGNLTHRDSLNNVETLKRGDLQMTSTGTGIRHSEYNDDREEGVHFLQIWALPHTRGLKPSYYTRHFSDAEKEGKLVQVVGPVGAQGVIDEREASGPAPVHAYLSMFATILPPSSSVSHVISAPFSANSSNPTKKVYVHVIQTTKYNPRASLTNADAAKVKINGNQVLGEGDGAFVEGGKQGDALTIESVGGSNAEVVVFEMD